MHYGPLSLNNSRVSRDTVLEKHTQGALFTPGPDLDDEVLDYKLEPDVIWEFWRKG